MNLVQLVGNWAWWQTRSSCWHSLRVWSRPTLCNNAPGLRIGA